MLKRRMINLSITFKNKYRFVTILMVLACLSIYGFGQEQTIPFSLNKSGNIVIKSVINGKDTLDLMFHTASNGVTITTEAVKKLKSVKWDKEVDVTSWGGKSTARYSKKNTLSIGSLNQKKVKIWENTNSGPSTDGKFGLSTFKNKFLEINFSKQHIKVSTELPKQVSKKGWYKIPLYKEANFLLVDGEFQIDTNNYSNSYVIHSGYGGSVLIDDAFADTNNLKTTIPIFESQELKDSYGNIITTQQGKVPSFNLGEQELDRTTVAFFDGAVSIQKTSIIGCSIISQFDWVIDKKRGFAYLKKRSV